MLGRWSLAVWRVKCPQCHSQEQQHKNSQRSPTPCRLGTDQEKKRPLQAPGPSLVKKLIEKHNPPALCSTGAGNSCMSGPCIAAASIPLGLTWVGGVVPGVQVGLGHCAELCASLVPQRLRSRGLWGQFTAAVSPVRFACVATGQPGALDTSPCTCRQVHAHKPEDKSQEHCVRGMVASHAFAPMVER